MRVGGRDFLATLAKSEAFVPDMVESQKFRGAL